MTIHAADTLALARDLAAFRDHLERAAVGRYSITHAQAEPLADAFLALLDAFEGGSDPVSALTAAMREWDIARARLLDAYDVVRDRAEADHQRRMAEDELACRVSCPACGAEPGQKCRSLGKAHTTRTLSHQSRRRLACSTENAARAGNTLARPAG